MRGLFLGLTLAVAGISGGAGAQTLQGALKPLQFLVGHWEGSGEVTATGGAARGVSDMTVEADGRLLLRRDRNEALDKAGHREGGLGQMMSIYEEGAAVRGDYVDGEGHVIHYGPATVVDGKSVEFTSVTPPGARPSASVMRPMAPMRSRSGSASSRRARPASTPSLSARCIARGWLLLARSRRGPRSATSV